MAVGSLAGLSIRLRRQLGDLSCASVGMPVRFSSGVLESRNGGVVEL